MRRSEREEFGKSSRVREFEKRPNGVKTRFKLLCSRGLQLKFVPDLKKVEFFSSVQIQLSQKFSKFHVSRHAKSRADISTWALYTEV